MPGRARPGLNIGRRPRGPKGARIIVSVRAAAETIASPRRGVVW